MTSLHDIRIRPHGVVVIAAAALAILAFTLAAPAGAAERPASISRFGLDGLLDPGSGGRGAHPPPATGGNLLLSKGVLTPLEDVAGAASTAYFGANNGGELVGLYSDAGAGVPPFHGFVRDKRGRFTRFDPPGASLTFPFSVNDRGQVVGSYVDAAGAGHGFLRDRDGDFTTIDPPGALVTQPHGINNRGQIVGFYADARGAIHGFLRTDHSYKTIDVPGTTRSGALDINDRGEIVGGYSDAQGRSHGYRLRRGVFATIDPPGAVDVRCPGPRGCGPPGIPGFAATAPFGINNRGQIAGQYADAQGLHAYLLDDGTYQTIDPPGGSTIAANINDRGEIVLPAPPHCSSSTGERRDDQRKRHLVGPVASRAEARRRRCELPIGGSSSTVALAMRQMR